MIEWAAYVCIGAVWVSDIAGVFLAKHRWSIYAFRAFRIALVIFAAVFGCRFYLFPNWWSVLAAVPLAYILHIFSVAITFRRFTKNNLFFTYAAELSGVHRKNMNRELLRNLYTSPEEELVYRGVVQTALLVCIPWDAAALLISALWFFSIHLTKKLDAVQSIDLLVFSAVVSLAYYFTGNLYAGIVLHILRNAFIILVKHGAAEFARREVAKRMAMVRKLGAEKKRAEIGKRGE